MSLTGQGYQQYAPKSPDAADQNADPNAVLEAIARYNEHGKALRRNVSLQEVALKLAEIAELAEQSCLSEADDWYDANTLKRNMKEIKGYATEFQKVAKEMDLSEQRLVALYDDMGRILERYFEIPENMTPEPVQQIGTGMAHTQEQPPIEDFPTPIKETGLHIEPSASAVTHMEDPQDTPSVIKNNTDGLTLRAIAAVYKKLKKSNPEYASRFAALSPEQMREAVWKLVG